MTDHKKMADYPILSSAKAGEILVPTVEMRAYKNGELPTLESYLDQAYDPLAGLGDHPFLFAAEASAYQDRKPLYLDEAH